MNRYRLFLWMILLALAAGLINAVALVAYDGITVSHITGLLSKFSTSVSEGDLSSGSELLFVILAFLIGAVVAGIATGERAFHLHSVYGCIVIFIGILVIFPIFLLPPYSVLLLAFLMGLQNGMVVSFKGILIRSTHMTGNLTDLGVYIGYVIRGNKEEKPISGLVPATTLTGFCLGGIIGILLYKIIGKYVFAAVSAVYIIIGLVYFYLQKTCNDKNVNDIPDDLEQEASQTVLLSEELNDHL